MIRVKFQNEEYIMIDLEDSFIAIEEQYKNGKVSFAHLYPDGSVNRFGKIIGRKEDIEVLEENIVVVENEGAFKNVLDQLFGMSN